MCPLRIPEEVPPSSIVDIADQVWAYATRQLTGSLDPTAAQIWAYVTRGLTASLDPTAAQIWAYATRELTQALLGMSEEASGTLTADGTVQEVVDKTSTTPFIAQLLIDTKNMVGADQIEIKESIKVLTAGGLEMYSRTRITGAQEEPIIIFYPKFAVREYRVTLQQLAGVAYRAFDWSLIVEEAS